MLSLKPPRQTHPQPSQRPKSDIRWCPERLLQKGGASVEDKWGGNGCDSHRGSATSLFEGDCSRRIAPPARNLACASFNLRPSPLRKAGTWLLTIQFDFGK